MADYLTPKALHIIGFVTWFAGLFYIVRLFVYRVEAAARPAAERAILEPQLALMTRRLWYIITWPGMVVTLAAGIWLVLTVPYNVFAQGWFHIKLTLLVGLVAYHLKCHGIYRQLNADTCRWSSGRLRMWNELATMILFATVFLAVFKTGLPAVWAVVSLISLGIVLMLAIRLYGRSRKRTESLEREAKTSPPAESPAEPT